MRWLLLLCFICFSSIAHSNIAIVTEPCSGGGPQVPGEVTYSNHTLASRIMRTYFSFDNEKDRKALISLNGELTTIMLEHKAMGLDEDAIKDLLLAYADEIKSAPKGIHWEDRDKYRDYWLKQKDPTHGYQTNQEFVNSLDGPKRPMSQCTLFLYIYDEIKLDDVKKLKSILAEFSNPPFLHVTLNSSGGSVQAGIEIGRIVRQHYGIVDVNADNLITATVAAKTYVTHLQPNAQMTPQEYKKAYEHHKSQENIAEANQVANLFREHLGQKESSKIDQGVETFTHWVQANWFNKEYLDQELWEHIKYEKQKAKRTEGQLNDEKGKCYSACILIYAGGISRLATFTADIGVHQHFLEKDYLKTLTVEQGIKQLRETTETLSDYFDELGINPELLQVALSVNKDKIRILGLCELQVLLPFAVSEYANVIPDKFQEQFDFQDDMKTIYMYQSLDKAATLTEILNYSYAAFEREKLNTKWTKFYQYGLSNGLYQQEQDWTTLSCGDI